MKRSLCILPLLAIGCSGPTIVGSWIVQDTTVANSGIKIMFEFTEQRFTWTTVMANRKGKDIRVTTSGTYSLVDHILTFTIADAKVNDSQVDRAAISKYVRSSPRMELRFIGKDKAELLVTGGKMTLARTSTRL